MKIDPYKHEERFISWKNSLDGKVPGISEKNSKIFLNYMFDMEHGLNVASGCRKGARGYPRLNNIKQKMLFLLKVFEKKYKLIDITKATEREFHDFFTGMRNGTIKRQDGQCYTSSADYVKVLKSFWHWHQKVNRKKGVTIYDITMDLDISVSKPRWVYLDEEQIKKLCENATYEYRVLITFLYDTGIRSPTELMNIRVSDFHSDFKELNIREEVSKTFGRRIKLMMSSSLIKSYVEVKKLGEDDYIFTKNPSLTNRYLKRLSEKLFGKGKSPAGETYDKLTMYDFRHCSCCYWLPRYKSESALKFRFGWKKSDKIHYYSEMLGMRDTIQEEDMLVDITKTELEKRLTKTEHENEMMRDEMKALREQSKKMMELVEGSLGKTRFFDVV
jgi:integrase